MHLERNDEFTCSALTSDLVLSILPDAMSLSIRYRPMFTTLMPKDRRAPGFGFLSIETFKRYTRANTAKDYCNITIQRIQGSSTCMEINTCMASHIEKKCPQASAPSLIYSNLQSMDRCNYRNGFIGTDFCQTHYLTNLVYEPPPSGIQIPSYKLKK